VGQDQGAVLAVGNAKPSGYAGNMAAKPVTIAVDAMQSVSGLWQVPPGGRACLVLAHGAGAGMAHKSMSTLADGLAVRGVTTLRYQFPYMERGAKRVDPPAIAHAAVGAAVAEAARQAPHLPRFAGGRSFGARMTSQAQARTPLPRVRALVFFAFPLHPPGKPSTERADHLAEVALPMLFIQGTRDEFARIDLLQQTIERLGSRATLALFEDADHSFRVPTKSGRDSTQVMEEILDTTVEWMTGR
jgi:predicted alpha/beta-hydrolase family hydrolase